MLLTLAVPPVKPRSAQRLGIILSFLAATGASRPGLAGDESEPGGVGDGEPKRPVTPATRPDV
ncbi:MAG TPA: hypothetical protein VKP30_24075, partial [Polyangiaceae bacterium]|nr:hypothetical protein [Polyangiaceae bacterium]